MTENSVEIAVQCDKVSVSYKGDAAFLEGKALEIIVQIIGACTQNAATSPVPTAPQSGNTAVDVPNMPLKNMTTKSIATRRKAKTGTELAMAAIAYLAIFAGRDEFTRQDILMEMKSATGFYKANMSSNLSKMLSKLIKDEMLHETGKGKYSLPESERARLVNELA